MKEPHELDEGEYCKFQAIWYARPPGTDLIACLAGHDVEEHEDGTLTVIPSILVSGHTQTGEKISWHGFLDHGKWRQV